MRSVDLSDPGLVAGIDPGGGHEHMPGNHPGQLDDGSLDLPGLCRKWSNIGPGWRGLFLHPVSHYLSWLMPELRDSRYPER